MVVIITLSINKTDNYGALNTGVYVTFLSLSLSVRACVRVCVRTCLRACLRVCVSPFFFPVSSLAEFDFGFKSVVADVILSLLSERQELSHCRATLTAFLNSTLSLSNNRIVW